MSELAVMRAQLHAYGAFDECVVIRLQWLDWGTTLQIDLDFVWRDDGSWRTAEDNRRIVSIRFLGVSEVTIVNDLNDEMAAEDSPINWGFGVIARLLVEQGTPGRSRLTVPNYKASFRKEGYTWIEVTFTRWEFSESVQLAHQSPLNID